MADIKIDDATQKDLKGCLDFLDNAIDHGVGQSRVEYVERHIFDIVKCLMGCKFVLPKIIKAEDRKKNE